MSRRILSALLVSLPLTAGLLSSCGTGANSSTTSKVDVLTIQASSLPAGYVGESFSAPISISGGVAPYAVRVSSGTLPPGLSLSNNTITGVPSKDGTYTFSIEANDANLSNKVVPFTITVNASVPTILEPMLPKGEIRGETRIPVTAKSTRKARAARVTWELPAGVEITQVKPTDGSTLTVWKQTGHTVTVDLGFRNIPKSGSPVVLLTFKPSQPVTLTDQGFGYQSMDGTGQVMGEKLTPSQQAQAAAEGDGAPAPSAAVPSDENAATGAAGATEAPASSAASTDSASTPSSGNTP